MTEEEMNKMSPYEKVKFLILIDGRPSDLEEHENLAMFWFGYVKALM